MNDTTVNWDKDHLEMLRFYLLHNKAKKGGCDEQQSKRIKVELWAWPKSDSKEARNYS